MGGGGGELAVTVERNISMFGIPNLSVDEVWVSISRVTFMRRSSSHARHAKIALVVNVIAFLRVLHRDYITIRISLIYHLSYTKHL